MENQFNRRVLFSVMGETAAVLTETLYALVTQKEFIPTEIKVVTTEEGKRKAVEELLNEENGAYHQFIEDYGDKYDLSQIHFDENSILVIQDRQGQALKDVRTLEANESAADQIVQSIGEICQDKDCQLHVSMAGGRKTMGFYAAYALSIFGRPQDKLSHVLVDREYECRGFYYPTPDTYIIKNSYGCGENKKIVKIDAKEAKVELADIPIVLLTFGISNHLYKEKITYTEMIKNVQDSLEMPSIVFINDNKDDFNRYIDDIEIPYRTVKLGKKEVVLQPRSYALLIMVIFCKKNKFDFDINNKSQKDKLIEKFSLLYSKMGEDDFKEKHEFSFGQFINGAQTQLKREITSAFSLGKGQKSKYDVYSKSNGKNKKDKDYKTILDIEVDLKDIDTSLIDEPMKDIF